MRTTLSVILLTLGSISAMAAAEPNVQIFTDAKKALAEYPDFRHQGEFVGKSDDGRVGVQVACYEKGSFLVTSYPGGLPGAGSDGKTFKYEILNQAQLKKRITRQKLKKTSRTSPTLGKKAPKGAIVLYDGSPKHQMTGKHEGEFFWAGSRTKMEHGDAQLHLEFRTPFRPSLPLGHANRGNSGIYLLQRYEVQICDSFGLARTSEGLPYEPAAIDNRWCGCVYHVEPVDVRMDFPPLTWQTYDIDFTAPRFDGDKKTRNARVTVRHNGVVVVNDLELESGTGAKAKVKEVAKAFTWFQSHSNPVAFRNVWMIRE